MRHFDNTELQHSTSLGITEQFRRWAWGLLEFVSSPFALVLELFWHRTPGRRYYSLLGVFIAYHLILIIHYVGGFLSTLFRRGGSFKPQFVIDPLNLQQPAVPAQLVKGVASSEWFYLSLKVFVGLAIYHKVIMKIRQIRKQEPALTVFSGESRVQFLVASFPFLRWISINDEDAAKRFLEPILSYVIAVWVITPSIDPLVGSLYGWCAIALGIKAHCVRTRHLDEMADLQDVRAKFQQLFRQMDNSGTSASQGVPRAGVWSQAMKGNSNGSLH